MNRTGKGKRRNKGLFAIALFKLLSAVALVVAAIGALNLFHKNVALQATRWIDMLRIDPDNRYIGTVLEKLRFIHTHELKQLAALTFFYAALFLVEGVGLALEKRWAEWLTIVATGLFIPMEVYELCRQPTLIKAALLLINILVVVFLAYLVRHKQARQ